MYKYAGKILDLPLDTENNFIENSEKRIVFGPNGRFWDNNVMRSFTLHPMVKSVVHSHKWSHLMICLYGQGQFVVGDDVVDVEQGVWAYIPPDVPHYFVNHSEDKDFTFLCIVPPEGEVNPLQPL
ncbi:cupin domain protein [Anaerotignum neopropionicum]|uniref:Cupin domain protein n=1 Tax=Anaerotignum neopropionicum TaxID=36847 RepID=A0A136WCR1_9FIRM|nr:cupin domain-containing protein [Anaerotignum neopropionicum]KXL52236.1 cupin domain protein [Anaerotignum neopropionicum]